MSKDSCTNNFRLKNLEIAHAGARRKKVKILQGSLQSFLLFAFTLIFTSSPFFIQSIRLAFSTFPSISFTITLQVNVIVDPFFNTLKFFPSIVAPLNGESISITSAISEKY